MRLEIAAGQITLIMELPRDVQLLAGSKINYFVYPGPVRSGIRRRIYVISTDWHSRKRSSAAVFGVCGKTISIPVLRNRVSIVTAKGQGRHTTVSVAVENEQLDQNRSGAN